MKPYIAIIIAAVLIVVVLAIGYISGPFLESPQARLYRQIDEKVELAQRILDRYNPAAPNLLNAFTPTTTQPTRIDDDKWRDYLDQAEEDTDGAFAALRTSLERQRGELGSLDRDFQELGGEGPSFQPVPSGAEALDTLKAQLRANEDLLAKARETLEDAIGMSEGEGESLARGDSHPEATRLLAIVIHAQADMLRRQAALRRAAADRQRDRFAQLVASSRNLDREIASLQAEIQGGTPSATTAPPSKPATPAKPPAAPAAKPGPKPAPKPAAKADWWILGKLIPRGPGAAPPDRPTPPEEQGAQPQETPEPAPEPVQRPDFRPPDAVPALNVRTATLQKARAQVVAAIEAAEAEVSRLTGEIESTSDRMETAQDEAAETQKKMLALEQQGVDPAEPASLHPFIERYNALAEANRRAAREAATLEHGAVRNARSGTDDIEDLLKTPLVPADPGKPMQQERGLEALKTDLQVAQETVSTQKAVLAEIDRQLADLAARRQSVEERLGRLRQQREELTTRIGEIVSVALAAVAQAGSLEERAIQLAEGPGPQAAQQARNAANDALGRTREFIQAENPTETPERKLTDMASDKFPAAHVAALKGDFEYLVASTYVQQADGLDRHQRMLAAMNAAAVPATVDPKLLGEDATAESVPESVTSAAAAATAAAEARVKAARAGLAALESYQDAADALNQMWVVHASIAAVHNLLADLPRTPDDADDHLAKARDTYERALSGRETEPDYPIYRRIADYLAAAKQPGS